MLESYAVAALAVIDRTTLVTINAPIVMLIISVIIPAIAGRLTKVTSRWTGPLMLGLNAVSAGLLTLVVDNGSAVFSVNTLINAVAGALASQLAYKTLLAPNGVTNNPASNPQGVAKLGPDKGIG